jgi:hypothetical protein
MRRTLAAVLVAVVTFAVTSFVIVGGFALVAGRSTGPAQGSSAQPEPTKAADPVPADSSDPAPTAPSGISTGLFGGVSIGFGPAANTTQVASEPTQSEPKTGVLSQDFRKLGLDDPTTVIDESLRSACEVVGGTIAGPVLCNDR